jgi:hypothetical protein
MPTATTALTIAATSFHCLRDRNRTDYKDNSGERGYCQQLKLT